MRIENQESNIYKHETCKVKEAFLTLKPNKMFLKKSQIFGMTEMSGAHDNRACNCNTLSLDNTNPECNSLENNEKQCRCGETIQVSKADTWLCEQTKFEKFLIPGFESIQFTTEDKILDCISNMSNDMIQYPITVGQKNTYFFPDL